jgi:hypothetical protein
VVRLANSSHVFFITHGDSLKVFPHKVLLDSGAQQLMLEKLLV